MRNKQIIPPPPPYREADSRSRRANRQLAALPALLLILAACEPPAPPVKPNPIKPDPVTPNPTKPAVTETLKFSRSAVRRSKMLVSANGNADRTFPSPALLYNGTAVTSGVTYSIAEKPAGFTDEITVNAATGEVTFGKVLYDTMTPTDPAQPTGPPATVTVRAAYRGKTASYTFTVTDHFSPRKEHTAVVMGGDIYVIGGTIRNSGGTSASPTAAVQSDEVWRSADGGLTWDQTATGTRFTPRNAHGSVVLNGVLYVIAGVGGELGVTARDDVWRSTRGVSWSRVTERGKNVEFPMDNSFASAVRGDTLYVLGGIRRSPFTRLNEVWQSADLGETWTQATNATDPRFLARSAAASVVLGNAGAAKLYVIGGYDSVSGNDLDDIWESSDGTSWTQVNASAAASDKFPGRSDHSAAVVSEAGGDTIYVIGGSRGGNSRSDVWKSVDQGATWDPVTTTNTKFSDRADHASVVRDGELYVIGGAKNATELFNDVWKSADGGRTWVNVHKVTAAK